MKTSVTPLRMPENATLRAVGREVGRLGRVDVVQLDALHDPSG